MPSTLAQISSKIVRILNLNIEDLPREIIVQIASLAVGESANPITVLTSLALVNRFFHSVAYEPAVLRAAFTSKYDMDAIFRRTLMQSPNDNLKLMSPSSISYSRSKHTLLQSYAQRENLLRTVQNYVVPVDIDKQSEQEIFHIIRAIWSLCTENDGRNTKVMEQAGVVDFVMTVVESLDFDDCKLELLQVSLRILSVFCAWDPNNCFKITANENLWFNIRHLQNDFGFFPNIFEASSGLLHAAHIFFRTKLVTSTTPTSHRLPPVLSPRSLTFDNLSRGMHTLKESEMSGTWYGYYNYKSFLPDELAISEALEGMMTFELKFEPTTLKSEITTQRLSSCSVQFNIVGQGDDSVGPFQIRGQMSESGQVKIMKMYTNSIGPMWIYHGVLNEIGLLGIWGDDVWGGVFWIWKEDKVRQA